MHKIQAVIAIIVAVIIGVVAQLIIKKGLNAMTTLDLSKNILCSYVTIFTSPLIIFGIAIYFASILLWLYALTIVELSYAYPFLALSYIFVILGSWYFLGESVSMVRLVGVLIIVFGVLVVARS